MRQWRIALKVARWEFERYVKPKQQVVGMFITILIGGGFMLVARLAARNDAAAPQPTVAIVGVEQLPSITAQPTTVRFTHNDAAETAALRERVRDRSLDGLLIIHDADRAELVVRRTAYWAGAVHAALKAARQQVMMERAGLSPGVLATILTAPTLDISYEERLVGQSRGERIVLVVIVGFMLLAVFIGMSYIFSSITGEKQIRVTEQIISAIPAQSWIDGKILGLIGVSIMSVLAQIVAFAAVFVVVRLATGAGPLPLPETLGDPVTVALIVLFSVLGLFFWFAFLGAIAAMIDDPHTSTRGSFLFVPLFASCLAFLMLRHPEGTFARVLSLLPPTAPSAMPVRLMLVDVAPAEIVAAIVLLGAAVLGLRIVAGRVFRLGMLMHGKEPSWAEVRRWAAGGS